MARLAARKWTSSTIRPPAPRNRERKLVSVPVRMASRKLLVNASAVSWTTFRPGWACRRAWPIAFEQVRLAQPDAAVDHQGIEGGAGRLGHLARRGVRQAVAGPGHEALEPPRRPPPATRGPARGGAGRVGPACIRFRGWG